MQITIPISTDERVTGRKLYRTKIGYGYFGNYELTTINDNTTTSFLDNVADADLGDFGLWYGRMNTTSHNITINGIESMEVDKGMTIFGYGAGSEDQYGSVNIGSYAGDHADGLGITAIGAEAGRYADSSNTYVGYKAGTKNKGGGNTGIGYFPLVYSEDAEQCIAIGNACLQFAEGYGLVAIGNGGTGAYIDDSDYTVIIGHGGARYIADGTTRNTSCDNGIFIGAKTKPLADGGTNEMVFGYDVTGLGSNTIVLGNDSITTTALKGNVGIGVTTPTALLHLAAGTATNPAMKFETGTLLTTPETGSLEFNGNKFYITNVGNQKAIDRSSDVFTETVNVTNTTTETTIYTAPIPANALRVGNVQKFKACGLLSTASASDVCTIRIKAGGVTIASIDNPGKLLSDECWEINACTTIRTIGTSGTCATKVVMEAEDETEKYCNGNVSIDTTSSLDITVTVEWNNAKTGNTIAIGQGWMEYKN